MITTENKPKRGGGTISDLACVATAAILADADFDFANIEKNVEPVIANYGGDDDLWVAFDLDAAGVVTGSAVSKATLRIWAYPSDDPSQIQVGRWQENPDRHVALGDQFGNINEYGSGNPGLPNIYSNDVLRSDVERASGGDFVLWIQTTMTK